MNRGVCALVFVLTACAGPSRVPSQVPEAQEPAPPSGLSHLFRVHPTSINLDRAEPPTPWRWSSSVDAMALASLRCIRVTVKEPTPLPRRVAAEALFDALRAQGLRIDRAAGMWLVRIENAHPPPACGGEGRATAASEAT